MFKRNGIVQCTVAYCTYIEIPLQLPKVVLKLLHES